MFTYILILISISNFRSIIFIILTLLLTFIFISVRQATKKGKYAFDKLTAGRDDFEKNNNASADNGGELGKIFLLLFFLGIVFMFFVFFIFLLFICFGFV